MASKGLSQAAVGAFKQNYEQLVAGVTGLVSTAHAPSVHGRCNSSEHERGAGVPSKTLLLSNKGKARWFARVHCLH